MYVYLLVDLSKSVCWTGYSKIMPCIVEFISSALWRSSCRIDYAELIFFHGEFKDYTYRVSRVGSKDDLLNEFPKEMRSRIEVPEGTSDRICGKETPIVSAMHKVVNEAPSNSLIILVSDLDETMFDEEKSLELVKKFKEKNIELILIPLIKDMLIHREYIKKFLAHYINEHVSDPDLKGELLRKLWGLDFRNITELMPLIIQIAGIYVVENYHLVKNIKDMCTDNHNPIDCCRKYSNNIVQNIEQKLNTICSKL